MIRMFIIGDSLPYHAAGRIGKTTFIIMMEESTMNICNGSQRVPVNITIKRDSTVLQ